QDPSLEGMAPFFCYFIQPKYIAADLSDSGLLGRFLVEVRYDGDNTWRAMPIYALQRDATLPDWANRVFDKVSHIRILFPIDG
ncbi:MAG: hypothetical protein PHH60_01065, partial [Candidatus Margulisbacteria bacterium]|nr:hypothetical protein [Candidatus Margulisiibacteriota bacterium]